MNICVRPAVNISLITARLERAYLARASGRRASLRIAQPPRGTPPPPRGVMLRRGLFVVFVSPSESYLLPVEKKNEFR